MAKTQDGLRVEGVAKTIEKLFADEGFEVRPAKRHPYTVSYPGILRQPCAIAKSTNIRTQVVPFLAQYSQYNSKQIYDQIRRVA